MKYQMANLTVHCILEVPTKVTIYSFMHSGLEIRIDQRNGHLSVNCNWCIYMCVSCCEQSI